MEVVEQKKDGHHQLMFESVLELVSLFFWGGAVVVAQLVERLLPTTEICGLNPVKRNL